MAFGFLMNNHLNSKNYNCPTRSEWVQTRLKTSKDLRNHREFNKKLRNKNRSKQTNTVPKIQATRNTSYLTASKSLNGRKIARMAPILTIFGPNRSQRRNLFFEKFSNERRRHRGIVVVVIVAVVVAVVAVVAVIGRFSVACIKGTSL